MRNLTNSVAYCQLNTLSLHIDMLLFFPLSTPSNFEGQQRGAAPLTCCNANSPVVSHMIATRCAQLRELLEHQAYSERAAVP